MIYLFTYKMILSLQKPVGLQLFSYGWQTTPPHPPTPQKEAMFDVQEKEKLAPGMSWTLNMCPTSRNCRNRSSYFDNNTHSCFQGSYV